MFKHILHGLPHNHHQWLKNHTRFLTVLSNEQKIAIDRKGIVVLLD